MISFWPRKGAILMGHHIVPILASDPRAQQYQLTPDRLEQIILAYRAKGYQFISLDELNDMRGKLRNQQSGRFACLTFDDGWENNYVYAYPLLKRLNCPFTIFLCTHIPEREITFYSGQRPLTREQIESLNRDPLCTFGAHTVTHPRLAELSLEEQQQEMLTSKNYLESITGKPCRFLAYPYGSASRATKTLAARYFAMAVMAKGGEVSHLQNPLALPRVDTGLIV